MIDTGKLLRASLVALMLIGAASGAWAKPHTNRHDAYHRDPYQRSAAAYAIVVDGTILWGRNLDAHRAPASLTKLLTALVLLDSNWQPDAILTVSRDAAHTTPSRVGLRTGEQVRAEDALTAMLMHSANDACLVLVEHAAGTLAAFAARMNARAAQLGMHDSHFVHPCGYDAAGQYSTVHDLLQLAQVAHADPRIARIVAQRRASITTESGRRLTFNSTNHLLGRMPGVVGLKTGYTAQAGRCLIALGERSGHHVWVVLLGARQRWWVAHRMLTSGFAAADRGGEHARIVAGT
ncbi:MAG TPA: serine hydrolase [Steroidobacteraceae bacterium]|jgi:D-alanyl-D-alanine carboxypeptidase (penicillin-binding protein 5/6)|nr:serine hydrolase [Steroidobacteraceae bacterium]